MTRDKAFRMTFRSLFQVGLAMVLCAAARGTAARAQDRLSRMEARYAAETDPVRKAKRLGELVPLEIDKARMTFQAGGDEEALEIITRYRDEVRITSDALTAKEEDPVRHSSGFKELQIGLRVAIRWLDDLILIIPVDKRPWFYAVRSDLDDAEGELIDLLFPTIDESTNDASTKK